VSLRHTISKHEYFCVRCINGAVGQVARFVPRSLWGYVCNLDFRLDERTGPLHSLTFSWCTFQHELFIMHPKENEHGGR
jgi:hypothetical protein